MKMEIRPSTFSIRVGMNWEYSEILLKVLADYLKNLDYENISYEEIIVAEQISDIFFSLKSTLYGGDGECRMNLYIMGELEKIIRNYGQSGKENNNKVRCLRMYFYDAMKKMEEVKWG